PHNPDGPPADMVEPLRWHEVAMRGTSCARPRCVALRGTIGVDGHCGISPQRPSVCRAVAPSWEFGRPRPQCDKGRLADRLRPLRLPAAGAEYHGEVVAADTDMPLPADMPPPSPPGDDPTHAH